METNILEDNLYVVKGPKLSSSIPNISLGEIIYKMLQENLINPNPALVDGITERELSYKEILGLSCTLAKTLTEKGYGKGSIISIISENNLEYFIPIISALYIGAIICPINFNYTKRELVHSLNITKPTVVFCSKSISEKFTELMQTELKFIQKIVIIDNNSDVNNCNDRLDTLDGFINTKELIYNYDLAEIESTDDDVAFVMLSSGTTGLPKGVMLTHKNILVYYIQMHEGEVPMCKLGILPFFHTAGLINSLVSLMNSEKIIVLKRFEENSFLNAISKNKIKLLPAVPLLVVFLAKSPTVDKYDVSCLKYIYCGGAPLSKETEEMLYKRLKLVVYQGYGLTETTIGVIKANFKQLELNKPGSIGFVTSYMRAKVRDPATGKSLGAGQTGELCVKGPMVMKGYFGNPEVTRNSFTSDGWLLTGDMTYYDEDGRFYIVDRLKELIKYKGFQIAPAELESVLLKHPEICDAGVVGLEREDVGELPFAFVVKAPESKLSEQDVEEFVAKQVSAQKKIRGGVIFIETIPKNPSGKILRRELRELLKKKKVSTC